MHIILFQPLIPPNTGNIIRLCANMGAHLDLIEPLGFELDDKRVRRAGLDYHDMAKVKQWPNFRAWQAANAQRRVFAISKFGTKRYDRAEFNSEDALLFGRETTGLTEELTRQANDILYIPMQPGSRSLNLSNSVSVVAYEAWRQTGFA